MGKWSHPLDIIYQVIWLHVITTINLAKNDNMAHLDDDMDPI